MNPLLKRQIRKYLPEDIRESGRLDDFIDAIDKSYVNSDNQFAMLQRATMVSSKELSEASEKLKKESDAQKEIIEKLKNVINTLRIDGSEEESTLENITTLKLVDFIDNQTKEILRVNQQKDELVKNLEKQNQELNDYTHMISHDLVSPLQSIETLTQWLIDDHRECLNEEGRSHVDMISDHVEKIDTLVESIRKYSRISRTSTEKYKLDLNNVIDTILREQNFGNNIRVSIPEKLPKVFGETFSFKELFFNLINNAFKFNNKEEKSLELGYEDKNTHWQFYVKDNGKGIEEIYFEKVFVAFSKLENDYKSAGMGMAIAKKVVEMYGGEIWLESEVNVGTTVYFTIKK
ncbi:MAG: ATP-binding protein [Tenacibaculum sp.]|nr:ATP-binding protein [Tenacibaculum sp.]